ncbi:MAG TPA: AAA family ATPase [Pseudonocardiaceae bacterium]|nr:AAA family ATPase [Pseudonocardiaceae bacterium]
MSSTDPGQGRPADIRFVSLRMTNFLSYRSATLDFGDFTALVGPNGSGKSNAISALRLLHDIPTHGLPTAISRRGGFEQLRFRDSERSYDPSIRLEFKLDSRPTSFYELTLRSIIGNRYEVARESARIFHGGSELGFTSTEGIVSWHEISETSRRDGNGRVPPGQSVVAQAGMRSSYLVSEIFQAAQTLEINPSQVGELQEPSSIREFEPDGSNVATALENLTPDARAELAQLLATIVPGIIDVDTEHVADRVAIMFAQDTGNSRQWFYSKQMSDGTLRTFCILTAMLQDPRPVLLVIEEPEIAIHLGALQTLVEILRSRSGTAQTVITTHSADVIDYLDIDDLRVVWAENGQSKIAPIADHTREPIRKGLITPGALLRADALDPAT